MDTQIGAIAIDLAGGKKPPEEIELVPAGRVETRPMDRRAPYLNDRPSNVVERTRANVLDLPIDYEHQMLHSRENGQPAPASGWITEVFERDGAVWGKVRWTDRAAKMIEKEEYRYLSPVFAHTDDSDRRILRIDQAALTNEPAFFMRALAKAAAARAQREETMDIKELLKLLGIPDSATDDEIRAQAGAVVQAGASGAIALAALGVEAAASETEIRAAATAAREGTGDTVPRAEHDRVKGELSTLRATRADEVAQSEVDAAVREGKIAPAQKDWALSYAKSDPEGFRAYAKAAPKIVDPDARTDPPDDGGGAAATAVGMAVPRGHTVDADRSKLHERAMARATRDKIPYVEAVKLEAAQ